MEQADRYAQIHMFSHLLQLASSSLLYLTIHANEKEICAETIKRTDALIKEYELEKLHQNVSANYHY